MFVALEEVFEYDGVKLIAGKVPRKFWACQNCAMYGKCCTDYGLPGFPECRAEYRKDGRDVVFFEWFPPQLGGRQQRKKKED